MSLLCLYRSLSLSLCLAHPFIHHCPSSSFHRLHHRLGRHGQRRRGKEEPPRCERLHLRPAKKGGGGKDSNFTVSLSLFLPRQFGRVLRRQKCSREVGDGEEGEKGLLSGGGPSCNLYKGAIVNQVCTTFTWTMQQLQRRKSETHFLSSISVCQAILSDWHRREVKALST